MKRVRAEITRSREIVFEINISVHRSWKNSKKKLNWNSNGETWISIQIAGVIYEGFRVLCRQRQSLSLCIEFHPEMKRVRAEILHNREIGFEKNVLNLTRPRSLKKKSE